MQRLHVGDDPGFDVVHLSEDCSALVVTLCGFHPTEEV